MRISCIVVTSSGREKIVTEVLRYLKKQTVPIDLLLVSDNPRDVSITKQFKCNFLQYKNKPVGEKWQAGVNYVRERFNPDAVMICASKNWLTSNWCEVSMKYIEEGYDMVGKRLHHYCRLVPNEKIIFITRQGYHILGSGRLFSKSILDKIDWKLFPIHRNSGLDGSSEAKILESKAKFKQLDDVLDMQVVGIRSIWPSIHSWKKLLGSKRAKTLKMVNDPIKWFQKNYPGSLEALRRVCPTAIIK